VTADAIPNSPAAARPRTGRVLLDLLRRPERHRYGPHRCHRAELYVPRGPGPHPVVVTIHGGYWRARYSRRLMWAVAADLVRRGRAVWNIEYRRLGRRQGGGWPATFEDVGAAVDHLAELGDARLDVEDVTVVGHSAGGQLALWTASRVRARVSVRRVVGQAAVCDLARAGEPAHALLGGTPEEAPERYSATDPMRLVPLGVPQLLVHTADDETIAIRKTRRYAEAARAAGDHVDLLEMPSGGHRVHIDPRTDAWRAAASWVVGASPPAKRPA
jgi:acetyl esterase/lipase